MKFSWFFRYFCFLLLVSFIPVKLWWNLTCVFKEKPGSKLRETPSSGGRTQTMAAQMRFVLARTLHPERQGEMHPSFCSVQAPSRGGEILVDQPLWSLGFPRPGWQHGLSNKTVSKMKTSQFLALLIHTYNDVEPMWSLAISPPSAEKNKGPSSLKWENRCSRAQARRKPRFTHGCWNRGSTSNF